MFCIFNPFLKKRKKHKRKVFFFFAIKRKFVIIEIFVKNFIGYDEERKYINRVKKKEKRVSHHDEEAPWSSKGDDGGSPTGFGGGCSLLTPDDRSKKCPTNLQNVERLI